MSEGAPVSGKAVDIWALGTSLFVILMGHVPFGDPNGTSWSIYEAICKDPLKIPEEPKLSAACK